jgi:hypothetical protein
MNCEKASNNRFFNSSARMADGRLFTDYRPNNEVNEHIINNNKIENTHNYRMFLMRHTDEIMDKNAQYMFLKNGLFNCKQPYATGTMLPERTRVVCDKHVCNKIVVDENGHGEGREYVTEGPNKLLDPLVESDIKINNICANSGNHLNYYPIDKNVYSKGEVRNLVPSGGNMLSGGDPSLLN